MRGDKFPSTLDSILTPGYLLGEITRPSCSRPAPDRPDQLDA
ncbi:hypothetical protein EYZ11_010197 [Aspergillus tanneri]|uniref:Uncharacterized protein n=1 Tax=Aspergillus tanneri TaxID=1220188 RepID=A0A4V6RQP8_9EURO|nr:hypothetical protein EYZ11_010197 [Aspergillus tanneri]